MRAAVSFDVLLTVLVLTSIYIIADTYVNSALSFIGDVLSRPFCLIYGQDIALLVSDGADVSVIRAPMGVVDVNVSRTGVSVDVNGIVNTYRCEVDVP